MTPLDDRPAGPEAGAILLWVDTVFAEAGVDGDRPLKREIANRLASLMTLGPIAVYALEHGAKDFTRWLIDEDQDHALDRIDEALRVVSDLCAEANGDDANTHLRALDTVLASVYAEQFKPWVHGVKTDYGS